MNEIPFCSRRLSDAVKQILKCFEFVIHHKHSEWNNIGSWSIQISQILSKIFLKWIAIKFALKVWSLKFAFKFQVSRGDNGEHS